MNRKNSGANTNSVQMCLDTCMLMIAFMVGYVILRNHMNHKETIYCEAIAIVFAIIYILANKESRIYNVTLFFYIDRFHKIITKSWLLATMTTALLIVVIGLTKNVRHFYILFLVLSYVFICMNMISSRLLQQVMHTYRAPKAAFVGVFSDYLKFNYFLNKTSMKLDEIGYILPKGVSSEGLFNVLGSIDELEQIIKSCEVDQIYFIQKSENKALDIEEYVNVCLDMGVTVKVIIDEKTIVNRSSSYVSSVGTYPIITYHTITMNNYEQLMKRMMDIIISIIAIMISSPIMLATIIAIKKESPGPAIFKQIRVGQNGRTFYMYKFRSMYIDAEERKKELLDQNEIKDGMMFKIKNDPRMTKVGRFIRRTSIDELPQLFNVLQGNMSLVGTRPPLLDEVTKYQRSQWRRISIKPGMTGMWQVNGRSDITDFNKVVELDLNYIDNWTIWLDIKILFKTIGVLLKKNGAY